MFNLFDILQNQSGGLQGFGQQFGLSPDQTRRAMEALLPALTIGLQRNAATDPTGLGRMFGFVGPGATGTGFTPPPTQADQLLSRLFGSPLLAQAVLQQASAVSGVGAQALRQMLPVLAGMIVAGIVHLMLNQPQNVPPAAPAPDSSQPFGPAAAFWSEWVNTVLAPPPAAPAPAAPQRAAPRPRDPSPKPSADRADPAGPWLQMFQTGADVHEKNVKAMQDIFDAFWTSGQATSGNQADDPNETDRTTGSPSRPKP